LDAADASVPRNADDCFSRYEDILARLSCNGVDRAVARRPKGEIQERNRGWLENQCLSVVQRDLVVVLLGSSCGARAASVAHDRLVAQSCSGTNGLSEPPNVTFKAPTPDTPGRIVRHFMSPNSINRQLAASMDKCQGSVILY
jgi:hypothetical protein